MNVNFFQVMERLGRRRLENGNFAKLLNSIFEIIFDSGCFLLTCLHGFSIFPFAPPRSQLVRERWPSLMRHVPVKAAFSLASRMPRFHGKPANVVVAVSLSTACSVVVLEFQETRNTVF